MTVPRARQRLMTADEFAKFMRDRNRLVHIVVPQPYELLPCSCGDVNCHGWRFIERRAPAIHVEFVDELVVAEAR